MSRIDETIDLIHLSLQERSRAVERVRADKPSDIGPFACAKCGTSQSDRGGRGEPAWINLFFEANHALRKLRNVPHIF